MGERLNIFFLVPSKQLGGCTSFTVHLMACLKARGYDPVLYKIGKGAMKPMEFPYDTKPAWTVNIEDAVALAQHHPSLIAYCFWGKCSDDAKALIELNVPMVVHDPAEFHDDELVFMREREYTPLVIRKANVAGLQKYGVTARYVPHPYMPFKLERRPKLYNALCLARIDFRKFTHTIIDANKMVEGRQAVHLFGEMNRIYEFHQLRGMHPDWRRWYHGQFEDRFGVAAQMFSTARFAVDLTCIKGDGGGTQYTFFEAWNAGVPLVLNKGWATNPNDEVREGESCVMVKTAEQLAEVLRKSPAEYEHVVSKGLEIMQVHGPEVVEEYVEVMRGS